ncbi:hypothetical protein BZG36_01158 [Bifiguratus adelaidae]|uniref:Uncharacterized protein n=1 Tax=Bifiguratus adelaidae TaxID=1938954 RepID=A0A261Y5Y0_9FUNG|nr:hypothetical protein BZG36_01158 [Bifiguratus adelaidae]
MSTKSISNTSPTSVLDRLAETPYPAWVIAGLSALSIPKAIRREPGVPSYFQAVAFAAIWTGSGFIIRTGDVENGAGIATAWGLTWSFLNMRKALASKQPAPVALALAVGSTTLLYGKKTLELNGYIPKSSR